MGIWGRRGALLASFVKFLHWLVDEDSKYYCLVIVTLPHGLDTTITSRANSFSLHATLLQDFLSYRALANISHSDSWPKQTEFTDPLGFPFSATPRKGSDKRPLIQPFGFMLFVFPRGQQWSSPQLAKSFTGGFEAGEIWRKEGSYFFY